MNRLEAIKEITENTTITVTGDLEADMRALLSYYLQPSDIDYYLDANNQ